MAPNKSLRLAQISLVFFGLLMLYLLFISSQPRMLDGRLELNEINVVEFVFIMTTVLLALLSWLLGIAKAINQRHNGWALGVLFVWPLTYLYLFHFVSNSNPTKP